MAQPIRYNRKGFSDDSLKAFYRNLLIPRMIEEKMIILLRQGRISKWFSGIGQEAISVGLAMAMDREEYILPMHRNLGIFTTREVPFERLFSQFQGKLNGFTKGRDRSFHFGTRDYHLVGMISHLGPQLAVADGIALDCKLRGEPKATAVFTGDGGASEGDFHEALNVAAVWQLPVIFVVENNGYGLSTPSSEQFKFDSFTTKGPAYGMEAVQVDGNNILEVWKTMDHWVREIRQSPRPVLIEAMTFRMRGHEEASGTKYVPARLMDHWSRRDPVATFEAYLLRSGVIDQAYIDSVRGEIREMIESGLEKAYAEAPVGADGARELNDVFAPWAPEESIEPVAGDRSLRLVDAISEGLAQSLEKHQDLVVMGQDIAEYGGVFKVTEGFVERFGKDRIRNTPLCESAILGAGLGLSVKGRSSVIEMQFADFVSSGFNQIVNNLAKSYYRWGQPARVVIRMPTGAGVGAGPYHSQSNEAWFFHTPGLKIVYPSTPEDAKGLLCAAIADPNPVLYFEHKYLYRSLSGPVPEDYYTTPIGQARQVAEGKELSVITYGMGVHWVTQLAEEELQGISMDVIDLRTLMPWDKEAVRATVAKTGKALVLHEDTLTGGIGAEIAAFIAEECFMLLDAPVMRVGSLDTPVPFASALENDFLGKARLAEKIRELMEF